MKRVVRNSWFFFPLLLLSNTLWAQNEIHSFYYPLNVGDFWDYLTAPAFRETKEVIGDTLMPNGQLYRIVKHDVFGQATFSFQRVSDANELFYFDRFETDENILFKLSIKVGDTWNDPWIAADSGFFRVTYLSDTTLWEQNFKYAVIQDFALPDSTRPVAPNDYFIADSLGIFFNAFEGGFSRLNGAIINGKKFGVITTVEAKGPALPQSSLIKQNYPNPFNTETRIDYEISEPGFVFIRVYNVVGQEVRTLLEARLSAGTHSITWNGKDNNGKLVSTGVYIYVLRHDRGNQTLSLARKLLMLR